MQKAKPQTVGYIDGYLLIIPKKNVKAYKKMAKEASQLWIKHGAISVKECMGDDLTPDMGPHKLLQFPKLMKAKPDDTVWYSYIEYASKSERNRINKKVEKEMSEWIKNNPDHIKNMPFDMKKMCFGGFKVQVFAQ